MGGTQTKSLNGQKRCCQQILQPSFPPPGRARPPRPLSCPCPQTPSPALVSPLSPARACSVGVVPSYGPVWKIAPGRKLTLCDCCLPRSTSAVKFLKTVALRILCSVVIVHGSSANMKFITTPWSKLQVCSPFISIYLIPLLLSPPTLGPGLSKIGRAHV